MERIINLLPIFLFLGFSLHAQTTADCPPAECAKRYERICSPTPTEVSAKSRVNCKVVATNTASIFTIFPRTVANRKDESAELKSCIPCPPGCCAGKSTDNAFDEKAGAGIVSVKHDQVRSVSCSNRSTAN